MCLCAFVFGRGVCACVRACVCVYRHGIMCFPCLQDLACLKIVLRVAWGMTAPLREKGSLDMIGSR